VGRDGRLLHRGLCGGHELVHRSRRRVRRALTRDVCWRLGGLSVHRLSPPAVRVRGDRALVELPIVIEFRIKIDGIEADLLSWARSQYRAQRADGAWRIARITSIYERDTLTPSVPGTQLNIDSAEFTAFRPSYRCLAWRESRLGRPLRSDLLGDDQPGPVTRQYEAEAAWLAGSV
jgi:hypothetical protein